jgi:hypothetical protein
MTNHPNRSRTTERRMEFMDWWHCVNVELHTRGVWNDAVWGETNWRYREHRNMTPAQCVDAVLKDREGVA